MIRVPAGRTVPLAANTAGVELLVISGAVEYANKSLPKETWLRFPAGFDAEILAIRDTILWMKSGHLSKKS
jgi:hypothetical protein